MLRSEKQLAAQASAADDDDPLANLTVGKQPAPELTAPSAWVRSLLVTSSRLEALAAALSTRSRPA